MNFAGRGAGRHQRRVRRHARTLPRQSFFKRRLRLPVRREFLLGIIRQR